MKKYIFLSIIISLFLSGVLAFAESDEEIANYNRAVDLYNQAIDDLKEDNIDEAIKKLALAKTIYPKEKEIYNVLGHAYAENEEYDKALENLQEYLKFEPSAPEVNGLIAQIYVYQYEDYSRAIPYLRTAIDNDPNDSTYRQLMGYVYEQLGFFDEAAKWYGESEQDGWTQQRLYSTAINAFKVSIIVTIENQGQGTLSEVKLWTALARNYEPYQMTEYLGLEPSYLDFDLKKDNGNNPIAFLNLKKVSPGEERNIIFSYRTQIYPQKFDIQDFSINDYRKESDVYQYYISPQKYIESDNELIIQKANELNRLTDNGKIMLQNIYDFVRLELPYQESTQTYGAVYALKGGPKCDCSEFSMLFVALCRASGIPARVVLGYTYDINNLDKNTSHAWAEVLLPDGKWIPFDPTNGKSEPNIYFASKPSTHIGLWNYSPLLQADVTTSILYKESEGAPNMFLETNYRIEPIPQWYDGGEIHNYDLESAEKLSPDFQMKSENTDKKTIRNKLLYGLLIFFGAPALIFLAIIPFLNKKASSQV